jgi:hypothetical protein
MCFHAGIGKTVLFGGLDVQIGGNDKTWTYDGTNRTEVVIAGAKPSPRTGARMAYDSFRGVCVMTGGQDPMTGTPFADTWEFDGTSWTQIASSLATPRLQGMLAFMPTSRRMIYYGGINFTTFTLYSDTQFYGASVESFGSGCAGTNGVPTLSASGAPRLGDNWTLNIGNLNTSFNLATMVFGFAEVPGGLDLGPVLGMPGCFLHVTPDLLLTATSGVGGNASWSWTPITGVVGDTIYAQALCLDPTVNAFGWTMSNALVMTLGH